MVVGNTNQELVSTTEIEEINDKLRREYGNRISHKFKFLRNIIDTVMKFMSIGYQMRKKNIEICFIVKIILILFILVSISSLLRHFWPI